MIKILNPHSSTTLKTAEILSKYRPIAPKPGTSRPNEDDPSSPMSQKITQSPYLRNLWPQLQARPTRTRKRGRGALCSVPPSPLALKKTKSNVVSSSSTTTTSGSSAATTQRVLGFSHGVVVPVKTMSFQAFPHSLGYGLENNGVSSSSSSSGLVTLSLLPSSESKCMEVEKGVILDLNKRVEVVQERDFLKQLQEPITTTSAKVIAPQPVRPVCSRINVSCINSVNNQSLEFKNSKIRSSEEVEEEVESDELPSVISDSSNRVRLVNSAYKEMMGQPECSWLDSMVKGKRICGEVMIRLCESRIPETRNGFSCWVRIEWGREGKEEFVNAFCDVIRLVCDSKDYVFTWKFHINLRESCELRRCNV